MPETITNRLKLNPFFSKDRVFPNYETALKYDLSPKYTDPTQLLAHYREQLDTTVANRDLIDNLLNEGKIKTVDQAKSNWKPLELPFSTKGYYAEPKLADMLNGLFRDENNLGFTDTIVKGVANTSKKMQEIVLSAGVPKTDINFFAIGQAIKNITAGDFKAIPAFVRSNLNDASIKWFQKNSDTLKKMASQGIDLGDRVGSYGNVYRTLKNTKGISEKIGFIWHKAFNEKTFGNFLPQLYAQTFKEAEAKALNKGLSQAEAEKFAGNVTKNFYGLFENLGRSKGTEDKLSALFFAPKFREGIIRTLTNTTKSITTEIGNPTFYKNRRLFTGMVLTYAGYNLLNKKLSGHYMWENQNGKEFDLEIPRENGDIVYVAFMPSFLAFARNMASGAINLGKGDFDTAKQKFGSLFSMPIKLATELWANKDYFGKAIYKETDTPKEKMIKMAEHTGLSVNHPFIAGTYKYLTGQEPLYQAVSRMLELPLKFSTQEKIQKQKYYEALDKQKEERHKELEKFRPQYDEIRELVKAGQEDKAQEMVDSLSEEDYKKYKSLKASEKRKATTEKKIQEFTVK